ncbi:MAG: carbon-nitrogen hydrolase family protein [Cytophagales bacterium]|nr:carbon-nitrogen hydrolase family protein [Cytophagales bacterium]
MIITLAQVQPKYRDMAYNLASQETFIRQAAESGTELIIFPEISISGYEPTLARELATTTNDKRFQMFQELADQLHITIITSAPLRSEDGITISLLIYQTGAPVQVYSKQFLPADEASFFVPQECSYRLESGLKIGLAICYELSVKEHFEKSNKGGLDIYMASTAKTADGSDKAHERMAALARENSIMTLFVNSIGPADGVVCNGRSAAWGKDGEKLGELSTDSEGLLIVDTEKQLILEAIHIG